MYSIIYSSYKATRTAYKALHNTYNILTLICYQNTITGHFSASTEGITPYILWIGFDLSYTAHALAYAHSDARKTRENKRKQEKMRENKRYHKIFKYNHSKQPKMAVVYTPIVCYTIGVKRERT